MNIAVDALEAGAAEIAALLKGMDDLLTRAVEQAMKLDAAGLKAIKGLGVDIGLAGDAFHWLGNIRAGLGEATWGSQGLHASLHELKARLERQAPKPGEPAPQTSGGKEPPPKP